MHTFASRIEIRNSSFKNISGHVVALDREVDDLGIYNGEYITIADSSFSEIAGSVATIYRGGTDESTFGPHFLLQNSTLTNVGKGKRNKTHASIFLHGVQVASIHNNVFTDSEPVRVTHTVGDPVTKISGNTFNATDKPQVLEL
jgi:poly(beta-D-mannuronate) lyase